MLNKTMIMGRMAFDPELKKTPSGVSVTSFSICTERDFGEHEPDFFDIVAWQGTAEFICRNFSKGQMILVAGHLQQRVWQDKNGNKRYNVEIVAENVYFCGRKTEKSSPTAVFDYGDTEADVEFADISGEEDDGELLF